MRISRTLLVLLIDMAVARTIKVYILMGQSNMLGEGTRKGMHKRALDYAVLKEHKYSYLWDGNWTTSANVRNVFVMASGGPSNPSKVMNNEFLTNGPANQRKTIGPELGIGARLESMNEPIMLLKSCIGGRSLGWDMLPPGSPSFEFVDPANESLVWTYAGYQQSPLRWEKGSTPKPIAWQAGIQYDGDVYRAQKVLQNLSDFYPNSTKYEIEGFFWWQGSKDTHDIAHSEHYETNLVRLIHSLRHEFEAPYAKFVMASLGQSVIDSTTNDGSILEAMLNVANASKYPEFKDNVATVYTHPLIDPLNPSSPDENGIWPPGTFVLWAVEHHKHLGEIVSYSNGYTIRNSRNGDVEDQFTDQEVNGMVANFTNSMYQSEAHYQTNAETYMNVGQAMGSAMLGLLQAGRNSNDIGATKASHTYPIYSPPSSHDHTFQILVGATGLLLLIVALVLAWRQSRAFLVLKNDTANDSYDDEHEAFTKDAEAIEVVPLTQF